MNNSFIEYKKPKTREENRLFGLKKTEARVRARVKPVDIPSKNGSNQRNKRKKNGAAQVRLSILSRSPPCPGRIFPLSFTSAKRLSMLSNKSPRIETKETISDKTPKLK